MGSKRQRTAQQDALTGILLGENDPGVYSFLDYNSRHLPMLTASWNQTSSHAETKIEKASGAEKDWEIIGTNAADADVTSSARGGIQIETAGAANDAIALRPQTTTNVQSGVTGWTFSTNDELIFYANIILGPVITVDMIVNAGFFLTLTDVTDYAVGNDADAIYFNYQDSVNGGRWQFTQSVGGTETTVDTKIDAVLTTRFQMGFRLNEDRKAFAYMNGQQILGPTDAVALTAATDLIPFVGVCAPTTAVARSIELVGSPSIRAGKLNANA